MSILFIRVCGKRIATIHAFALALLFAAGTCRSVQAQSTFKLLHGFLGGNDGAYPASVVTLGPGGSIYGTTMFGGPANLGTVFYISPRGFYKILYEFVGGSDGEYPSTQLMELGGSYYGTTILGGVYSAGTVFKVDPNGVETVVHSFSVTDGQGPYGALIHDAAGNIYGATSYGSAYGYGNVYRIDPKGSETVIYSFTGGADGKNPFGRLARDARGNIYGTTLYGGVNSCGSYNCGNVFKIDANGVETVLYSFGGFSLGDGELPQCDVLEDLAGNIYGTTASQTPGIVFKVSQAGQETILHNFVFGSDGGYPGRTIARDAAGNIFGTVGGGTEFDYGGVFKLDPSDVVTILYSFTGSTDGAYPSSGVVRDSAGNLYGTTSEKGVTKTGTVFELTFP